MSDAARTQITHILANTGVKFNATYLGEEKNALGDKHPMDAWRFIATREGVDAHVDFNFFTGVGLREAPVWGYGVAGYDKGPAPRPGTMLHVQWQKQAKPRAPHPADLLHSLICDAEACNQSFESWCGGFGYDTDSRSALQTYEACQRNGDKLRKLFDAVAIQHITDALQDY